jgi:hypothetical protein
MIISIDAKKAFDKIEHNFMIIPWMKPGIGGSYLNIINSICDRLIANVILNGKN